MIGVSFYVALFQSSKTLYYIFIYKFIQYTKTENTKSNKFKTSREQIVTCMTKTATNDKLHDASV